MENQFSGISFLFSEKKKIPTLHKVKRSHTYLFTVHTNKAKRLINLNNFNEGENINLNLIKLDLNNFHLLQ